MKQFLYELWCALIHKCPQCGGDLCCDDIFGFGPWYCPHCDNISDDEDDFFDEVD